AERIARGAGATALGGDQHDALRGTSAVDRRRGGALQDLDRLDVARVDVSRTVADRRGRVGKVTRLERRVVDRLAVDDEKRLAIAFDRLEAADDDRGARAGVARLRRDLDARCLCRE